jgi:hypothetical protein
MNFSWCLSSLKKGSPRSPSFEINLFSLQCRHTPDKILHVFDAGGSFHLGDGGDLLGVGFDAAMADDEAE